MGLQPWPTILNLYHLQTRSDADFDDVPFLWSLTSVSASIRKLSGRIALTFSMRSFSAGLSPAVTASALQVAMSAEPPPPLPAIAAALPLVT